MNGTELFETTLIFEIPNVMNEEILIITPGQGMIPVSIISNGCCEEKVLPHLFPACKIVYYAPLYIPISLVWYFS